MKKTFFSIRKMPLSFQWTVTVAAFFIATLGFSSIAFAQTDTFKTPHKAVEYRQGAFNIMSHHFGRIGAVVKGKPPFDAKQVAQDANIVATVSQLPWAAFGPETKGQKTHAKPEIWTAQGNAKFQALSQTLVKNTADLQAAAQTGDLNKIKAAFGQSAKTCKACHDSFAKL